MNTHELYMQRCIELAYKGSGSVAPNPMVGAVLVYNDCIIGEGWHQQYGQAHAEVNCINSIANENKHLIATSTLYVSLEPCNHLGKTPPCTQLIIEQKIKKVVIGCTDSFEKVNGSGIQKLKDGGIEVITGVLEADCRRLNKCFFTFHEKKRPYIILKWAQTNDGFIANNDKSRIHISNEETNKLVHKWRSEEMTIMVGQNTAILDNPSLTTRLWAGKNPIRIIIGDEAKLSKSLQLFDTAADTMILNSKNPTDILKQLVEKNITSVLIEGGSKLLQSFIDANFWDEARVITNEKLKIDKGYPAPILKKHLINTKQVLGTNKIEYIINNQ